ncbi:MAG TPA: SprT family zinc-dependent metalloprotease [Burkholderiaceae bacterium]|nr:SprT family zinc-dependent metalloprotease [Burkholderiaceae bacterium]
MQAPQPMEQLSLAFDAPGRPSATPPTSEPVNFRQCVVGAELLSYRLRRGRRRSIGFQIDDNGLTVSAPRWVPIREVEAAIREKQRWITTKLAHWRDWRERRRLPEVRFGDGGSLPYLGAPLVMRLRPQVQVTQLSESGPRELLLALPLDADAVQVKDALYAWLQGEARRVLGERLHLIAARNELRFSSWALSSARSQWGSCTAQGRIRLNWRLVHFAMPVIDYVVAHELAHLRELNHGPRFWRAVAQLLPDFEAARDRIRDEDLSALPL